MESHTKTAEKIKSFVDRMDTKIQELNNDLSELITNSKIAYRKEIEDIKHQTHETKEEMKQKYEQRLETTKISYDKTANAARSFLDTKLDPLNLKIDAIKQDVIKSSHQTEEKWEEVKDEVEELFETTKLAFHNFKETFKEGNRPHAEQ